MSVVARSVRAARPLALAAARRSVVASVARLHSLSAVQRAVAAASEAAQWQPVLSSARSLLRARPATARVATPYVTALRAAARGFASDAAAADAKPTAEGQPAAAAAGAAGEATAAGTAGGAAEWEKKLAERDKQVAELKAEMERQQKEAKNELLRTLAEMQNVRRIAKQDVGNAHRYALQSIGKRLVDVLDTLQRATQAVPGLTDEQGNAQPLPDPSQAEALLRSMHEGVTLTEKLFLKGLAEHGFKRMESMGQKVDPNLHNVLFQVEDPSKPAGTIVNVAKEGYVLHERVIRPADVGVVKAQPKKA